MEANKILDTDYLDILFDGRNKIYGGYELRSKYKNRMITGTAIAIGFTLLFMVTEIFANGSRNLKRIVVLSRAIKLKELPPVNPAKPFTPPPPPKALPPVRPSLRLNPPVITKDDVVIDPPPQQTALKNVSVSNQTQVGDPSGIDPGIPNNNPGTGVAPAPAPSQPFTYVEQMPEPSVSLAGFLGKNLNYPNIARENNIEGRVVLQFIVDEQGNISDIQVLAGLGGGCDQEAVRVLKSMPPWKPGKQNGRAVKVYFKLPIYFKLE